ncbi:hypothetical protein KOW79_010421 [Hemibagrus wyckioides]|uniref:Uncharacterized protein n=1 Tax=Hemibagrus wyckioides TaxID=337641 RepID=A0A9D3SKJ5_9TELE|nr:hypothetical protein KOW79_010421 [Hemibagrus wyckioides]
MAKKVLEQSPKALGTVQIIIGVVVFMFSIVLNTIADSVIHIKSVSSSVMYWGPLSFIISGVLSIISLGNQNPSVVKTSLAMNVISFVTAIVAACMFNIDGKKSPDSICSSTYCKRDLAIVYCQFFWKHVIGNSGVLRGFSILQVFASIATIVLTWINRRSTGTASQVTRSTGSQHLSVKMPLPSLKTDPKSLGIVQIMNGAVILLFGVVLRNSDPLSVRSGAVYWGSLCFLSAGSLSVAVMDHRTSLVMKSSLVMNLLSAVAAVLTVIMFCVDLVHLSVDLQPCYDVNNKDCLLIIMLVIIRNVFRILLLFSVLEVCMAIWTFVLVWKSRNTPEAMATP